MTATRAARAFDEAAALRRRRQPPRGPRRLAAALVLACAAYPFVAYTVLSLLTRVTPVLYDAQLTRLDGPMGHAAILWCHGLLVRSEALRVVSIGVYDGSVILALVGVAFRWRLTPGGDTVLPSALLLAAFFAPFCYYLVPAVGPVFAWSQFPDVGTIQQGGAFRNAMPSLHFAVTLIVLAALWRVGPWARAYAVAFAAITVLATLGFGEHYVVDLLAAIPYAALMWFGATTRRPHAAFGYGVATVATLTLIRLAM